MYIKNTYTCINVHVLYTHTHMYASCVYVCNTYVCVHVLYIEICLTL